MSSSSIVSVSSFDGSPCKNLCAAPLLAATAGEVPTAEVELDMALATANGLPKVDPVLCCEPNVFPIPKGEGLVC